MRTTVILGLLSIVGGAGCASTGPDGVTSMQPQSAGEVSSVRIGAARLLGARVNPSAGVPIAADGDAVVVRFSHVRGGGEVERLDPSSLYALGLTTEAADRGASAPAHAQRVVLDGGRRFMVLWKSGDAERGYRAMAQAFNTSDDSPRGAPVAISPTNADVSGPLSAATSDGRHVVATFAASTNRGFAAYAVPLEAL